jgi:hypothetical protein
MTNGLSVPRATARLAVAVSHFLECNIETCWYPTFNELLCLPQDKTRTILQACGVTFAELLERGATTPDHVRQLGFDALFLCDPDNAAFTDELIVHFGHEAVRGTFVCNFSDAVAVAGPTATKLRASLTELLGHCRRQPRSAEAVLDASMVEWRFQNSVRSGSIRLASPLATVDWRLLIECEVVFCRVSSCSLDVIGDLDTTGASVDQLKLLGLPVLNL